MKRIFPICFFALFFISKIFCVAVDDKLIDSWNNFSLSYVDFFSGSTDDVVDIEQDLLQLQIVLNEYKQANIYKYAKVHKTNDVDNIDELSFLIDKTINKALYKNKSVFNKMFLQMNKCMTQYLSNTNLSSKKSSFIFAELLIVFSCTCIFVVSMAFFTLRKTKETEKLKEQNERSKLITNTIISVQEAERERISQELHDSVTQDIRAVQLYTREIEPFVVKNEESMGFLSKIKLLEERNLKNIRSIIKNLISPEFENAEFKTIIAEYCADISEASRIPCMFFTNSDVLLNRLDTNQKLNVFRIIQEAVHNAEKHADPQEISVLIREDLVSNKLLIFITDDGCGIEASKLNSDGTHLGLKGIKSRVEMLNAELAITSDCESGTELRIEVPVTL